MTREEFDIELRKVCDATKGCVVFMGSPTRSDAFLGEFSFDAAWWLWLRDGYTGMRVTTEEESNDEIF